MLRFLFFLSLSFSLFFFSSCEEGQESDSSRSPYLPSYIGQAGEIAVIIDTELWESSVGDSIRKTLQAPIPLMPAYEQMFDLYQHPPHQFNKVLKPFRNVLFVDIEDNINYQQPKVEVLKERYAKDQMMIKIGAKTKAEFHEAFSKKADQIVRYYNDAELERAIKYFKRFNEARVVEQIQEKQDYEIMVPNQSDLLENRKDFVWVSRDMSRNKGGRMHDVQQGILIYEYPYVDDSTFTKDYLLNVRDSILKENVPGPVDSSWMSTSYFYDPVLRPINLNDEYAAEIRGLWRVENAFMGGPFISVTKVDEARGKVVTAEGYVFAPKFDKREYLREMEAVVKSLEFD